MIQSPSYYDPEEQETAALERRNYVLERMAAEGYLSSELAARSPRTSRWTRSRSA